MKYATRFRIPYWYLLLLPTILFYFGAALNQIVMAANGGTMPVLMYNCSMPEMEAGFTSHSCMTHATHLKFLADWINLHFAIASIGDMLLWLGEATQQAGWLAWALLIIRDANETPLYIRDYDRNSLR